MKPEAMSFRVWRFTYSHSGKKSASNIQGIYVNNCYNHPGVGAAAICEACGRGICAACALRVGPRIICRECAEIERNDLNEALVFERGASGGPDQPERIASEPAHQEPALPGPVHEDARESARQNDASSTQEAPRQEQKAPETPMVPVVIEKAPLYVPPPYKPYSKVAPKREPLLAAFLSLVVPGLGQVYNEHLKKGVVLALLFYVLIVAIIVSIVTMVITSLTIGALCCMPSFIFPAVILLYAVYDAYETAVKINRGEEAEDWF